MIMAFFATRAGKFAAIGLAVVLAVVLFLWWLDNERDEAVSADRAASNAQAVTVAREADQRAQEAAVGEKQTIEEGTRRAEAAAVNSDDPLRDAFRSLRAEKDRDRQAPK